MCHAVGKPCRRRTTRPLQPGCGVKEESAIQQDLNVEEASVEVEVLPQVWEADMASPFLVELGRQRPGEFVQLFIDVNDMIDIQVGGTVPTRTVRVSQYVPQDQMELAKGAEKQVDGRLAPWLNAVDRADAQEFVVDGLE